MVIKGVSTLTQNMKRFYGPDNYVTNTMHPNPMGIVTFDIAGPLFLEDRHRGHDKTYILTCVELLTYKCHLIPLPHLDKLHFVRALEILQAIRNQMATNYPRRCKFSQPPQPN